MRSGATTKSFQLRGMNSAERGLKPAANEQRTVHLTFTPFNRCDEFRSAAHASLILHIFQEIAAIHTILIHEAVAMPDHVHLLVSFNATRNLERDIVKNLKGASAHLFLKRIGSNTGRLWGQKKHFENVEAPDQFNAVMRYIRENPSKAGIPPHGRIFTQLTGITRTLAMGFSPCAAGFIPQRNKGNVCSPSS